MASVTLEVQNFIATLTINRPESLNALNREVLQSVLKFAQELKGESAVRVVILKGSGEKAFVAGADIKEMQSLSPEQAQSFAQIGVEAFSSLAGLPQIVIAQVQGFALGGGLEFALSADFIVASEKAKFGMPEVTLGLIPGFGGTQRLASRIGVAKALEWLTTADKYSAEEALRAGLVSRVVAPEALESSVMGIAQKIVSNGPAAVRNVKNLVVASLRCDQGLPYDFESAAFGLRFQTSESREGIGAFLEKRAAKFPPLAKG
jgi:enoyl-CoA hydratase